MTGPAAPVLPTVPVALSTGSVYTYGTARAFELAARAGYDGVEVIVDDRWDTRQPAYLRRLTAETGVPVLSVHSPFGAVSGWPQDEVERVERSLELAEAVGARTLNVHLPFRVQDLSVIAGVGAASRSRCSRWTRTSASTGAG